MTFSPIIFLFYFALYYHLLYWFYSFALCSSLLSTSSHTCPRSLLHNWIQCIPVLHMVFLPCNSAGLWLPHSYCFVFRLSFINLILFFSHFAPVSVLLCLNITQVRIPSIMEFICPATPSHSPPSNHLQQPYWLTQFYRVYSLSTFFPIYHIIISCIFIPWIHTGLHNPYGYGNSHICLRSLEVKSI
jgi:hypothetical protein